MVRSYGVSWVGWVATVWLAGCGETAPVIAESGAAPLVHMASSWQDASIESEESSTQRAPRAWSLVEQREAWTALSSTTYPAMSQFDMAPVDDGIRVTLKTAPRGAMRIGGMVTAVDGGRLGDWERAVVTVRSSDRFAGITCSYNIEDTEAQPGIFRFFESGDDVPPLFNDGSVQRYAIPLHPHGSDDADTPVRNLAVILAAPNEATADILSVTLEPRGVGYPEAVGERKLTRDGTTRHALYAHAPASLAYPSTLPESARLDVGFTVEDGESVTYRVLVAAGVTHDVVFEEVIDDASQWHQRAIDLSAHAGKNVDVVLEADSDQRGAIAIWGAPVLGGARPADRPDVVLYVIDGGDSNFMSLYGYGDKTTPFLEQLADESVVFTRAHSNATWTQPSTVSFMTSLQHSVLGGLRRGMHSTPVPDAATTLADHFRRAGYVTASFTSNPNAGRMIGLDRGMDLMRDVQTEHHSTSSIELQDQVLALRAAYPNAPLMVHVQTTDVHEPNEPVAPFKHRFTDDDVEERLDEWDGAIWQSAGALFGTTSIVDFYDTAIERAGIDRKAYFEARRDLYAETMAYQDYALADFLDELADDVWHDPLLIIGSDHGHPAGTFARFGRGLLDPQPEPWQGAMFDAYATGIPFIVHWPGHIEGGRRIDDPVSMIDVLPTLLDLVGLPQPDVLQGQSLAPLLRGEPQQIRPVILDEFRVDEATGEMIGNLEIVDGRWGASLEISPKRHGRHAVPAGGRWAAVHPHFDDVPSLLLYDLENDPHTTKAVNDKHPALVDKYRALLEAQWSAHQALAPRFSEADVEAMTAEQLEQLKRLGYIR